LSSAPLWNLNNISYSAPAHFQFPNNQLEDARFIAAGADGNPAAQLHIAPLQLKLSTMRQPAAPIQGFQQRWHEPYLHAPTFPSVTSQAAPVPSQPLQGRIAIPHIDRSRKTTSNAWKIAVQDWENPDPARCRVPLQDWQPQWYQWSTCKVQKYHIRKVIALEFIERFVALPQCLVSGH
jgi:hypothetical protein